MPHADPGSASSLSHQRYRKAAGLPAEEGDDAGSDDELAPEPVADLLPPVLAEGAEAAPPTADDLNRLKRKLGHQRKIEEDRDPLAPTVQGCLLAQALLKLGPDEAEVVVNSCVLPLAPLPLSLELTLSDAHHPTTASSRRTWTTCSRSPTRRSARA